ncbi:MAG: hypothetical protein KFF73_02485 [Cyclobacteriaceae bacterium]|nr:hypothetical protein [Cyclobacteriaceae bacterium]
MEELHKLIGIVKQKSQRSIQLVNQNFRKSQVSKDNLLYEGIVNEIFPTEEIAAKHLFNTDPGNRNYRNTKAKLKQKLFNHLYFLDYNKSGYSNFLRAKYECLHLIHQMKILVMEEAGCIAIKKLPQLIKTAKDYELIELALDGLLLLRNEFSLLGKCSSVNISEKEIHNLKPFYNAIINCEEIYYDTIVLINKSYSSGEKVLDEIPDKIREIERTANHFHSSRLDILAKNLKIAFYKMTNSFEEILQICDELEKKYITRDVSEINVDLNYREFTFLKILCLYTLNKSDEGISYSQKKESLFKEGTDDWFRFKEYQFLFSMKGEKFRQAAKIFRIVKINKNFGNLGKNTKTRWTIYRAYILFINDTKLIKWGFDIDQFKNTIPKYPKKLLGYSIATLFIQFMFFLREGNATKVKQILENLRPLNSTHLDKRHNYRNSVFIRMLEIVIEKDFEYETVREKCINYFQKLKEIQIPPDFQLEMEIIPLDILWEYILNILKTNKFYIHYRFYNYSEI